jgi:hypothetical protein
MTAVSRPPAVSGPTKSKTERLWSPHFWEGCDLFAWVRLLVRNRCAISLSCAYVAVIVSVVSVFHTLLRWLQNLVYGRAVERTPLAGPPIFIIGHWRTGTTWLHELLTLDDRFVGPNTYQCIEPNHFLLTEGLITRWLGILMPTRRPMDNMKAGWNKPQEDEFALCMMGVPSPYLTIAFPNRPPQDTEFLDLEDVSPRALRRWKAKFLCFLKQLTFKTHKRLVLKSPTHTCRIKTLLEMFPDACFVHIVRNPYVVYPSTVNLWKSLYRMHGLQTPTFAGLEEQVFSTFVSMYERLDKTRSLVPEGHFHELKYEELVRDPVGEMRRLYDRLGLGDFDTYLPRLQQSLTSNAGYETNRYDLPPETRTEITQRWGDVIRKYGYVEPA